jgi:apolipoprotein N-acyltransferase
MWGTSQSLARSWSAWPALIQFVSLTGITGIVFALGTLEAMVVYAILRPKARRLLAAVAAVMILAITGANIALQRSNTKRSIKVAAIGWCSQDGVTTLDPHSPQGFDKLFAQPVARAAAQGAKLVVTGETAFHLDKHTRTEWIERFADICKRHNIYLAVGCYDGTDEENRVLFIAPNGEILAQYTKTHLTPFEHSNRGDGQLAIVDIDGIRTGAMICQDDNFTTLTRDYGRKCVPLMAVPTLDWSTVKDIHLQTTVHRAIESRQTIVRAAINGTSAIISPTGKILAKSDHFKKGPSMIIAKVPIRHNKTIFARLGHWPVILSSIYLAWYIGKTHKTKKTKYDFCFDRRANQVYS